VRPSGAASHLNVAAARIWVAALAAAVILTGCAPHAGGSRDDPVAHRLPVPRRIIPRLLHDLRLADRGSLR
jgi:hypothetical protein